MLEREIEAHLVWAVRRAGGVSYKFKSPVHRGVADRIVCLPGGGTWFIELKTETGVVHKLQRLFHAEMDSLEQNHAILSSKEGIDQWLLFALATAPLA